MKICWDNLERANFSNNGNFRLDTLIYIEVYSCKTCGEPYLTRKQHPSLFCCHPCSITGKVPTIETRKKLSKNMLKRKGCLHPSYKGGVTKLGLTTYDAYKDRLEPYEDIRRQTGTEVLEVMCVYCGKWYKPKSFEVNNRIVAINSLDQGEQRFYCSENCKKSCPTYKKKVYPKGFKHTSSREVDPYLRKMEKERDNWTCQICGKTINEAQLHCHHMDPATQNPMFQNDADSCITLCKGCHEMVHKQVGCRYIDLRCNKDFKDLVLSKDINLRI